ncbi:hypothetical protein PR048_000731 [Dryococelus australis]|uniref:Uncharacterized protein n=1 Tax=Dryococelus australis TaxID=614101 RepID=A0ABQ9IFF1_9NEOP|nr:hypothetical protein PR048_000731 [Dryococelus australis]
MPEPNWYRPGHFQNVTVRKLNTISAYIRQNAKSKYRNCIRLERASQNQSSSTHKTPYDRVKRCRKRKINFKASELVNVGVFTPNKRPIHNALERVEQEEGVDHLRTPRHRNPCPTNGIVRHDSHLRRCGVNRPGIEPGSLRCEASSLATTPPWPFCIFRKYCFVASYGTASHSPNMQRAPRNAVLMLKQGRVQFPRRPTPGRLSAVRRSAGMQTQEERDIPEKTRRSAASSKTILMCENQGVRPVWESSPRFFLVGGELSSHCQWSLANKGGGGEGEDRLGGACGQRRVSGVHTACGRVLGVSRLLSVCRLRRRPHLPRGTQLTHVHKVRVYVRARPSRCFRH